MDEASIIMYLKAISVLLLILTFCTLWTYSFDCDSRVFPIVWGASVTIFIGLGIYLSFDDIYEDNNQIHYRVIQNGDYYRVHYLRGTRTNLHYSCEFSKEQEHQKLLELCRNHKGPCVISCYDNPLYAEELTGWKKEYTGTDYARSCGDREHLYESGL